MSVISATLLSSVTTHYDVIIGFDCTTVHSVHLTKHRLIVFFFEALFYPWLIIFSLLCLKLRANDFYFFLPFCHSLCTVKS